jgi:hypothetical protein
MSEKMNIYQKLQKCRVELQKSKLKKSGHNDYANYDYFELGDFLPRTQELFAEHGLIGLISPGEKQATLTIRDTDKPEDTIVFYCDNAEITLKGAHAIQNIGAVKTYQRRYLWIDAMEISEHDAVEKGQKEDKPDNEDVSKKLVDENKIKAIRNLLTTSKTDEKQFLEFYEISSFEEMTVELWLRGMKALEKKIKDQKTSGKTEEKVDLPI